MTSSTHVTVYLMGTAHISNDSSADVKALLDHTRPDVVFLELCEKRMPLLEPETKRDFAPNVTFWEKVKTIQEASGMAKGTAIGTVLLTQVQGDYAESLGVELGGEFRAAWEHCLRFQPICILGDRPLQVTMLRAWESLTWWGKFRFLVALLWSLWQKPNPQKLQDWMQSILEGDSDLLTESMAELRKAFPTLANVILQERDAYMACKIYQTCRSLPRHVNVSMVAIVGAGHCEGICDWLTNGNGQQPEDVLAEIVKTRKFPSQLVAPLVTDVTHIPCRRDIFSSLQ